VESFSYARKRERESERERERKREEERGGASVYELENKRNSEFLIFFFLSFFLSLFPPLFHLNGRKEAGGRVERAFVYRWDDNDEEKEEIERKKWENQAAATASASAATAAAVAAATAPAAAPAASAAASSACLSTQSVLHSLIVPSSLPDAYVAPPGANRSAWIGPWWPRQASSSSPVAESSRWHHMSSPPDWI
jgi:hypothetical protein